jgi:restriction endonuclease S subunit
MDAKFGGYGIIPAELDGAIVSSHYYLYELDQKKILPTYLDVIIDSGVFQEQIKAVGSTNYSRVSPTEVLDYEIPCPSLTVQKKIATFYAKSKEKYSALNTELTHQQTLLDKLRQAILQEAIEGKLTAGWRKQNPHTEPAAQLLARIRAEKAQRVKEKKIAPQKPLPPLKAEEIPFALPEGWVWCRIGQVGIINRGKGPKYDVNGKKKIINQKCVRWFYVDTQYGKTVSLDWYKSLSNEIKTEIDDILVNSTGDGTIGRSAIVDEESAGLLFDSHILRLKTSIKPNYITLVINSRFGQNQIESLKGAKSTKQTELGVNNLSNLIIPLPPLAEQQAIAAKVERLLAVCDELAGQNSLAQNHAAQLMQAVLKEAFTESR